MEIPDVLSLETILTEWGNDIRDRAVMRYASNSARNASDPTPEPGQISYVANRGALEYYHGGAWIAQVPPGTIIDHAGGSTPTGYLVCDGQAVSRSTFSALFAQIGTIWGEGNGSTTFNVPDLRGRVTRGVATSGTGASVGDVFGSDTHNHTNSNTGSAGSHSHSQGNTGSGGSHNHGGSTGTFSTQFTEAGAGPGGVGKGTLAHSHSIPSQGGHTHSNPNTNSGGSHSHSQGNTGSSSNIQRGAATIKLIKT